MAQEWHDRWIVLQRRRSIECISHINHIKFYFEILSGIRNQKSRPSAYKNILQI